MEKVLLTGGGTGGHIYPNLALLPALYRLGIDAVYGGGEGDTPEHRAAVAAGLDFRGVPVVKFVRSASRAAIANNLKIPRILARGRAAAKEALLSEKPAVVFSKGGFAALPFVLAAADLGIPVICHESDKTAGLCNKIAARKGAFALSAYPGSRFGVFVGMPVREELFCKNRALARESLGLPPEGKVLLVTGGSSGAKALNDALAEVLPALRGICTVVHLTGRGKSDGLPPAGEGYLPMEYSDDMGTLYAASDLVLSRAGATAVAELSALGKRAVFVAEQRESFFAYLYRDFLSLSVSLLQSFRIHVGGTARQYRGYLIFERESDVVQRKQYHAHAERYRKHETHFCYQTLSVHFRYSVVQPLTAVKTM